MRAVMEYVSRTHYVGGSPRKPATPPTGFRPSVFAALHSICRDRFEDPLGPFAQTLESNYLESACRISHWLRRAPIEEFSWMETGLVAVETWDEVGLASEFEPHLVLEGWIRQTPPALAGNWLWLLGVGGDLEDIAERWGESTKTVLLQCQQLLDSLKVRIGWLIWYHNVNIDLVFGGTARSLLERAEVARRAKKGPMNLPESRWRGILKDLFVEDPAMLEISADTGAHKLPEPAWVAPPLVG